MKNARTIAAQLVIAGMAFGLASLSGCSAGKSFSTDAETYLTIVPPASKTVGTGTTLFVLSAEYPSSVTVTWTLSGTGCTGAACGTLINVTGTSVDYVAPATISGSSLSVTISASSTSLPGVTPAVNLTVLPTSVTIAPPASTTVSPGASLALTASVANDQTGDGVKWSLSGTGCSGNNCGTLTNVTTTSVTYTAPVGASTALPVAVTATSVASPTQSASLALTVPFVATLIRLTPTNLPPAIAGQPYSQTIQATSGTAPYTITATNLPSWATVTSTPTSITLSGTPTAAQTGTSSVTLSVTDSTTPTGLSLTAQVPLTTYANAPTADSLLTGSYAFYGSGWKDGTNVATTSRTAYIGSFTADGNGNITGGELDVNNTAGITSYTSLAGSYDLQANQTGFVTLLATGAAPITLAISLNGIQGTTGVATTGNFAEYDDTTGIGGTIAPPSSGTRISGPIALQSPAALGASAGPLSGNYAFGMLGGNSPSVTTSACESTTSNTPSCNQVSVAGVLTVAPDGTIATGEEDVTQGEVTTPQIALSGALNNAGSTDSSGRLMAGISAGSAALLAWPQDFVIYVINPQTFYTMSIDSYVTNSVVTGKAMQQNLPDILAQPFNPAQPIVLYGNVASTQNYPTPNGAVRAELQLLTVVPSGATAGSMSGTQFINASSTYSNNVALASFTYAVDGSGRVAPSTTGEPILYLVDTSTGFGTSNNASAALFQVQPQTSTSLNAGTYGWSVSNPNSETGPLETGSIAVPSAGVPAVAANVPLTGQASASFSEKADDEANSAAALLFSEPLTGSISNSNGVLNLTLSSGIQACSTGGGYVISATSFACITKTTGYGEIHVFAQ